MSYSFLFGILITICALIYINVTISQGFSITSMKTKKCKPLKKHRSKDDFRPFIIKPIPSSVIKPVLVFINPKSGGNQGAKLYKKFCWLLNPRQVFDLSQGNPNKGFEIDFFAIVILYLYFFFMKR